MLLAVFQTTTLTRIVVMAVLTISITPVFIIACDGRLPRDGEECLLWCLVLIIHAPRSDFVISVKGKREERERKGKRERVSE